MPPREKNPTPKYTAEFRAHAVAKARLRGDRTIDSVAAELHLSIHTLKYWLKTEPVAAASATEAPLPVEGAATSWSAAQRLQALMQSYGLEGEALNAWCRENGVFSHQLAQWRQDFSSPPREAKDHRAEVRDLQGQNEQLQRELRRKEKALAEAAALLVLQKKFRALWGDEGK